MKKTSLLFFLPFLLFTGAAFQPTVDKDTKKASDAAVISNFIIPFSQTLTVNQELVSFTGDLHIVTNFFPTDPVRIHTNAINITGTGLTSGLAYKVTGSGLTYEAGAPNSLVVTSHFYNLLPPSPILPPNPIRFRYSISFDADGFAVDAVADASIGLGEGN